MRRLFYPLLCLLGMIPGGCQTTPGFSIGASFTVPPTLNTSATLHPVATQPAMSYAVEMPQQSMSVQRQYVVPNVIQAPAMPIPNIQPRPQMEMIPAPKAPCQPACQASAQIVSVE